MSAVRPSRFSLRELVLDILSDPESDIITASKATGVIFLTERNDRMAEKSVAERVLNARVVVDPIHALVKVNRWF
jgi:hypothetical protein